MSNGTTRHISFTTVGTTTWVVPGIVSLIWVTGTAAGGGGAGGASNPSCSTSGGGSGGWCLRVPMPVVPGETLTIVIGSPGVGGLGGGSGGNPGGSGGDSIVTGSLFSVRLTGGGGATAPTAHAPEASHSGAGGNGPLGGASKGENQLGDIGTWFGYSWGYGGGNSGGGVGAGASASMINGYPAGSTGHGTNFGGAGGASIYGLGGAVADGHLGAVAGNPAAATSYGAAGGGTGGSGVLGSAGRNGGTGAGGRIDITYVSS